MAGGWPTPMGVAINTLVEHGDAGNRIRPASAPGEFEHRGDRGVERLDPAPLETKSA
jgi:hypothetical protein